MRVDALGRFLETFGRAAWNGQRPPHSAPASARGAGGVRGSRATPGERRDAGRRMRDEHDAGTDTVGSAFEGNPFEGLTRRQGRDLMVLDGTCGMDGSHVERARGGREGKGLVDAILRVGQTRTLPTAGTHAWLLPTTRRVTPLGGKTVNGRAGCGKPARPVRREGRPNSIGLPYPYTGVGPSGTVGDRATTGRYGRRPCRNGQPCNRGCSPMQNGRPEGRPFGGLLNA